MHLEFLQNHLSNKILNCEYIAGNIIFQILRLVIQNLYRSAIIKNNAGAKLKFYSNCHMKIVIIVRFLLYDYYDFIINKNIIIHSLSFNDITITDPEKHIISAMLFNRSQFPMECYI